MGTLHKIKRRTNSRKEEEQFRKTRKNRNL